MGQGGDGGMFKARCHSKKEILNFYNIEGSDDLLLDKIVDCGNTSLCYEVSNWGEGHLEVLGSGGWK